MGAVAAAAEGEHRDLHVRRDFAFPEFGMRADVTFLWKLADVAVILEGVLAEVTRSGTIGLQPGTNGHAGADSYEENYPFA